MESQIEMMKKTIDDLRSQAMDDKMTEYFKDDGISMPDWCEKSAVQVYEDIVEIYKALWSVNPTLDDINRYSEKEFILCPGGYIIYQDDYNNDEDCDCENCQDRLENTCGNCDTYYSDGCISHKSEALLCEECSIDKDGEPECSDGMNCEWCDVYREENEEEELEED